ncbi:flagellar M-ring protein FliF [Desemzia sp. RIT804]|uniref:flagellar basal-body MS-ring/collar protein FliF n=1 Tax=Desemzia sp. RIT 804 TaxID=2810209 RepID=UPI00194E846D|nr:flagellar basal-body MS-ring/collar protein FliF [Desemzia sp. RIT 804]MBM6614700.1 flagellar M-ring protein FliF [Desemzia sp. RIT 804]
MDNIKQAWGKVQGGWQALDKNKRIQFGVILLAIILVVGSLTYYTKKVDYSVLFADMEAADAGVIVEDLEAQGVAYKLEDNGTSILIDSSLVDKYRIELAMNNMVPANSVGFEIFDTTSMMATDEDRSIMYQRAVSGELQRAITTLGSVDKAQVILSMPEDSVFVDQENRAEASASVVITPRSGSLSASEVQGIASLISGAVDNLPQENIKIVDTNGNLLSSVLGNEGLNSIDLTSQYREIEAGYEQELVSKLKETLGPIYGMENLTISVNAILNFDAVEEEAIDYDPNYISEDSLETEGPVVRSESVQASGSSMTIGDETGGNDNVSNVIMEGEAGDGSSYNRTVNNEIDTKTTHTVKAPGTVTSLSASIVYNGNLNLDQSAQIGEIAQMTIGADPGNIVIQGIPFVNTDTSEQLPIGENVQKEIIQALKNNWPYAAGGIGLIILLVLLLKIFKKRRETEDEFDDFYDEEENDVQSTIMQENEALIAKKTAEKEEADLKLQLNRTMSEKEDKVKTMAKENPEMAADLIKIWMKEE